MPVHLVLPKSMPITKVILGSSVDRVAKHISPLMGSTLILGRVKGLETITALEGLMKEGVSLTT